VDAVAGEACGEVGGEHGVWCPGDWGEGTLIGDGSARAMFWTGAGWAAVPPLRDSLTDRRCRKLSFLPGCRGRAPACSGPPITPRDGGHSLSRLEGRPLERA
jgi:hypothetical protein